MYFKTESHESKYYSLKMILEVAAKLGNLSISKYSKQYINETIFEYVLYGMIVVITSISITLVT
jgi:hypothetical protein